MRKPRPEKVSPEQRQLSGLDSRPHKQAGSNTADSRPCSPAVQDAAFARFMQATQQPVPLESWPFEHLTPSIWAELPPICREALDQQISAILAFWAQQSQTTDRSLTAVIRDQRRLP